MLPYGLFYKNVPYPPINRIPLICLCSKGKHAARFPLWRERGTSLWLVESRILYVGIRESMKMF